MPDVATLKARRKITMLVRPERQSAERFSPTRYPYTYACDHVRSRMGIDSRAEASGFINALAKEADLPREHVCIQLAEAYIVQHNIEHPGATRP